MVESMHPPKTDELREAIPALTSTLVRTEMGVVMGTDRPDSVDEMLMGLVERGMWNGANAVRTAPDYFIRLLMETADYDAFADDYGQAEVQQVPRDVAEELNRVIRSREWDLLANPHDALRESGADLACEWAREHPGWFADALIAGFEIAPYYYAEVC